MIPAKIYRYMRLKYSNWAVSFLFCPGGFHNVSQLVGKAATGFEDRIHRGE